MRPAEVLEELEKLLDEMRELTHTGTAILVEGRNDLASLKRLQITRNVRILKGKGTLLHTLENLENYQEIIILTDFDHNGRRMAEFCAKQLTGLGVRPNLEFRKRLIELVGREVKDIEGLAAYMAGLRAKLIPVRSTRGTF